jgi:hypothetical protein
MSFAGYCVIENGKCDLFGRVKEGGLKSYHLIDCLNPIPWPSDWPETVSEAFIQDRGFIIHRGTVADWQRQYQERLNGRNLSELFGAIEKQIYDGQKQVKSLNAQIQRRNKRIKQLEQCIHDMEARVSPMTYPLPNPPLEAITIRDRQKIPQFSGCYFGWEGVLVRYVGKAVNLRNRLNPSHHALDESLLISWVEIPIEELYFAEAFYIGTLRPRMNKAKPVIERCGA